MRNRKTKAQPPRDRRREAVTIVAAATRGAIDRYFELFLDELDRINHFLQLAERWTERGGKLPRAVVRYQELAKLAFDTAPSCHGCGRCDQCKAAQELSRWSLLGFDEPIRQLFDLMVGRTHDLDAALAQLESTFLDLSGNGIVAEVIMAHAFARAGYAPGSVPRRRVASSIDCAAVEGEERPPGGASRSRRSGLRVLEGGKSTKRRADAL